MREARCVLAAFLPPSVPSFLEGMKDVLWLLFEEVYFVFSFDPRHTLHLEYQNY